jgi:hypothetical protein
MRGIWGGGGGELVTPPEYADFGENSTSWGRGDGLGCLPSWLLPPREFLFFASICPFFLLLFLPLDAALLFDVNAAIVGWLLLAVQL